MKIETIGQLNMVFTQARDEKKDICVEITIPGQEETEYIINKNTSLGNKLAYYEKAYGENLVYCMNDKIRIISAFPISFGISKEDIINGDK